MTPTLAIANGSFLSVWQVWECLLDYEAFRSDTSSDLTDVPKIKDGSVLPWCAGTQHAARAYTARRSSAQLRASGLAAGPPGGPSVVCLNERCANASGYGKPKLRIMLCAPPPNAAAPYARPPPALEELAFASMPLRNSNANGLATAPKREQP
jgi:hypothetical protein